MHFLKNPYRGSVLAAFVAESVDTHRLPETDAARFNGLEGILWWFSALRPPTSRRQAEFRISLKESEQQCLTDRVA
jgi:hypothetical protein